MHSRNAFRGFTLAIILYAICFGYFSLACAQTKPSSVQIPGLIGWWPGEGSAKDLASKNDGVAEGGLDYPDGVVGKAFGFDGKDDSVAVPFSSKYIFSHDKGRFTLAAWVYPDTYGRSRPLIDLKIVNSTLKGWDFGMFLYRGFAAADAIPPSTDLDFTGTEGTVVSSATGFREGTWHFVVMTLENDTWKLYLDGRLEKSQASGPTPVTNYAGRTIGNGVTLGSSLAKGGGILAFGRMTTDVKPGRKFRGMLDEVRLYDRALTEQEVKALYMADSHTQANGLAVEAESDAPNVEVRLPATSLLPTGEELAKAKITGRLLKSQTNGVSKIAISPTGNLLACGYSDDSNINFWDLESGALAFSIKLKENARVDALAFSADGKTLAVSHSRGLVVFVDVATKKLTGTSVSPGYGAIRDVAFLPGGKQIIGMLGTKRVGVFNLKLQKLLPLWSEIEGVQTIALSPDGKMVAAAGTGGVKLRTVAGEELKTLMVGPEAPNDIINSLAFSPDGRSLAAGSKQGTIRLWDVVTGEPTGEWPPQLDGANEVETLVAFASNSEVLMVASKGRTKTNTQLRDAGTGKVLAELPVISANALGYYRNGQTLIAVGTSQDPASRSIVTLWDIHPPRFAGLPGTATLAATTTPPGADTMPETVAPAGIEPTPATISTPSNVTAPEGMAQAGAAPPTLIGRWSGEGNAKDPVGGNDAALQGGMGFGESQGRKGFSLDGENDFVAVPFKPEYYFHEVYGRFTIAAWVLPTARDKIQALVDMRVQTSNKHSTLWSVYLNSDNRFMACNMVPSADSTARRGGSYLVSKTVALPNTWYFVTLAYDNGNWRLYVNGNLESSDGYNGAGYGLGNAGPLVLTKGGALNFGRTAAWTRYTHFFKGIISGVRLHNRALSGQDIQAAYKEELLPTTNGPALPRTMAGTIFFHSNRDGNDEIYSMDASGRAMRRWTTNPANDGGAVPNPQGSQVAFSSNRDGNLEVYRVNADGSGEARLTNALGNDIVSSWSESGSLAFYSNRNGNYDIFVMDDEGRSLRQLTSDPAHDVQPALSPNAQWIAFSSNRGGNYEIYAMTSDGAEPTRLTRDGLSDREPSWSPDGKSIAWTRKGLDGNEDIYIMNADGSAPLRLTTYNGKDVRPTFSPDGDRIIFASDRDGNMEIYAVDLDGSNLVRLTKNLDSDLDPYAGMPGAR